MDVVASRNLVLSLVAVLGGAVAPVQAESDPVSLPAVVEDGLSEIPPELRLPEELPPAADVDDDDQFMVDNEPVFPGVMDLAVDQWPARLESSGTWFRRGFWYVEQDVVVMNRDYTRDTFLAVDASNADFSIVLNRPVFPSKRELTVEHAKPDAAAAARLTLGRFLFRDDKNRDHMTEFTYLGLGHWSVRRAVQAVKTDRLFSPQGAEVEGITYLVETGGYNLADVQRYTLNTEFDSFEWNYRLRCRHRKDQMELGPDGRWTRKMMPNGFHSYLFGLRYLHMRERFAWQSEAKEEVIRVDLPNFGPVLVNRPAAFGDTRIRSRNDMIGFQVGADAIHQRPRWSVGVRGKAGPYINFAKQETDVIIVDPFDFETGNTEPGINDTTIDDEADEETISLVGELGVFAHYHVHPNVTLRVAYEAMWLSSVANAAEQVDFDPVSVAQVKAGGSQTYMGVSFGIDFYW